ncbi:hypothetical protein CFIMG_007262RA00001 [Ceratocystis fimbriata CBS 114723]|uniref:Uncharacterized protein n=1 Tax=Ceratocystis fimbriata CBS 114723 TaxID=1035309 RepID=A0A2C5WYP2_9PEZI|nr:hypothetical protein CFIMG_007262RA00001 [Ceratocystis fimbriata CBS 114723]
MTLKSLYNTCKFSEIFPRLRPHSSRIPDQAQTGPKPKPKPQHNLLMEAPSTPPPVPPSESVPGVIVSGLAWKEKPAQLGPLKLNQNVQTKKNRSSLLVYQPV